MENYKSLKGYAMKKFLTDKEDLKTKLDEFGVAIIPSVLNDEECESLSKGMWDFFEHITQKMEIPLDRNDKKTFIFRLDSASKMLLSLNFLRVNKNLRSTFCCRFFESRGK